MMAKATGPPWKAFATIRVRVVGVDLAAEPVRAAVAVPGWDDETGERGAFGRPRRARRLQVALYLSLCAGA
jgi:hypothetical protein